MINKEMNSNEKNVFSLIAKSKNDVLVYMGDNNQVLTTPAGKIRAKKIFDEYSYKIIGIYNNKFLDMCKLKSNRTEPPKYNVALNPEDEFLKDIEYVRKSF